MFSGGIIFQASRIWSSRPSWRRGGDDFTASARKRIEKYFVVSRLGRGGRLKVSFNEEAVAEAYRYFGYFALVGNQPLETFEAREDYRLREKVEEAFADQKGTLGGWSSLRSFRTPPGVPANASPPSIDPATP